MTKKNSTWNDAPMDYAPFFLRPAYKDYLWGGRRLADDFGKTMESDRLAESWECSTHPEGSSLVTTGIHKGQSLREVIAAHPEYLGSHGGRSGDLPVLVKLIDANQNLSVQVHPDDAYANQYENGQQGKTEMWYVLDATPGATLVYGLHHEVSKDALRQSLQDGTVEKYLQQVAVQKDDVFFMEPGTIHAIGSGILIAEIQQNSNLTYRLFDYNRVDKQGNPRTLHIEKGLAVSKTTASLQPRQPMRVLRYRKGCARELLCRCSYFEVHRLLLNTERNRQLVDLRTSGLSFQILLCVGGCGTLYQSDSISTPFFKGDCIFIPANSMELRLHGRGEFLDIRG